MNLTDRDKQIIKDYIDRGEPLPAKYKLALFADAPEVELVWQGKSSEVTSVVLPFQSIEQIDEPRQQSGEQVGGLFTADARGRQSGGWTNKLIWGDNKLVLSSLKNGPMRREIEAAGGLKLIYIDPPFDVGADFSVNIEVGEETLTKEPSLIEELAYRDTWGRGTDSYLSMMYERLKLMRDLLSEDGSIYVHVDENIGPFVRMILDETIGVHNFINSITWKRSDAHSDVGQGAKHFGKICDSIFYYSRNPEMQVLNMQFSPLPESTVERWYRHVEEGTGRRFNKADITGPGGAVKGNPVYEWKGITRAWRFSRERMAELDKQGLVVYSASGQPYLKRYLDESKGVPLQDLWDDIKMIRGIHINSEGLGYDTQKPEALLDRIIKTSSNEGNLVADFFCGSGTTLAVAEKLGRKWIGCDLGRFAIHTTRKRLIGVQRELAAKGAPYRSFEILNLGKYERQYFVGIDPNLPEPQRREQTIQREEHYLTLILSAYKAERVFQMPPFHGKKGSTAVMVGPIDAPVTLAQVNEIVAECRRQKISKADVLGFEFEMGLTPAIQDEAKAKGVSLSLKYIPKDVFDKRAVERGQVQFYDVAYVEVLPKIQGMTATVTLKNFGVFYRQDSTNALGEQLKPGGSKVTVDGGQVVKVTKDKGGKVSREVLTKKWTDWIDYWAVDFDYASRKEIIRVADVAAVAPGFSPASDPVQSAGLKPGATAGTTAGAAPDSYKEVWTGNYIFENEWQSYRTRKNRALEFTSAKHEYKQKGRYKIAVKVIDIFGNDTTKVVEVKV